MATLQITETDVRAVVTLRRGPSDEVRIVLVGQSLDENGAVVRSTQTIDITDDVSQAVRDGAGNLLTNIENRLKTQWNIP